VITVEIIIVILAVLAAAGIGVAIWLALKSRSDAAAAQTAGESAKGIITQAEEDSRKVLLAAQEEALKLRNETESDLKDQRQEFHRMENRHLQREEQLERKTEIQDEKERDLISKESAVERVRVEAEELKAEQSKALERVAGLSVEEAREQVVRRGEEEAVHDLSKRYYELEKEYKEKSTQNARKIITIAINRLATDVVSEVTTSTVSLPNDEMKGRLIGREGRNIRTLEGLTGVDVIIDDTPEAVTVSCFDPVRREVARLALEKLVSDGRIQPARIEEMVNRAQEEIDQTILKAGEQATFDAGVSGLDSELIRLLGQLKYRYSYGENVLKHSIEVSLLSGMLAAEAGANVQVAKMGGCCMTSEKRLPTKSPAPTLRSAPRSPGSMASTIVLTGVSWNTTATTTRLSNHSWSQLLTPSVHRDPAPVESPWSCTSNGSRSLKRSPPASTALSVSSPSRQGARSGSW